MRHHNSGRKLNRTSGHRQAFVEPARHFAGARRLDDPRDEDVRQLMAEEPADSEIRIAVDARRQQHDALAVDGEAGDPARDGARGCGAFWQKHDGDRASGAVASD